MSLTLTQKLNKIKTALTGIENLTVAHYWRSVKTTPFCIWQEDSEVNALDANNIKAGQVISGTVDLFTKTENDPFVDSIQSALNAAENVGFALNSVQYEEETNLIHYEWVWTVI